MDSFDVPIDPWQRSETRAAKQPAPVRIIEDAPGPPPQLRNETLERIISGEIEGMWVAEFYGVAAHKNRGYLPNARAVFVCRIHGIEAGEIWNDVAWHGPKKENPKTGLWGCFFALSTDGDLWPYPCFRWPFAASTTPQGAFLLAEAEFQKRTSPWILVLGKPLPPLNPLETKSRKPHSTPRPNGLRKSKRKVLKTR